MLQPRRHLELSLESLRAERGRQMRVQHLDRYGSLVFPVVRKPDGSHAAAPQLALDDVRIAECRLQLSASVDGRLGHPVAGSNGLASTSSICVSAHDCLSAFASAYSGDSHQRRAVSTSANSRITNRSGAQVPSRTVVAPPRVRYVPPYFA